LKSGKSCELFLIRRGCGLGKSRLSKPNAFLTEHQFFRAKSDIHGLYLRIKSMKVGHPRQILSLDTKFCLTTAIGICKL